MKRRKKLKPRKPMRLCGQRYASADEAARSKDVLQNGHEVIGERCPGCKGFHTRIPLRPGDAGAPRSFRARRVSTGFPAAVKLAARTRAGGGDPRDARCEAGGEWLGLHSGDIQHRDARGIGGSSSAIVNGIANAAVLCRECHSRCEARDPEMEAGGWWIDAGSTPEYDPRFVPVRLWTEGGPILRYLAEDGLYSEFPPGEVAA